MLSLLSSRALFRVSSPIERNFLGVFSNSPSTRNQHRFSAENTQNLFYFDRNLQFGRCFLSTSASRNIGSSTSANVNPSTPNDESSQSVESQSKDWFANRYRETSFHAEDGVDPKLWALIYHVPDEKQQDRRVRNLYALAVGSTAFGIALMVQAVYERSNPFAIGPGLVFLGTFAAMYAFRFRKYGVLRIYSLKESQEQWEHWFLIMKAKPAAEPFNLPPPVRHYKIIWKETSRRKGQFDYSSQESSDSMERHSPWSRALNGNFLVKSRPWCVHPDYFDERQDYFLVRQRSVLV